MGKKRVKAIELRLEHIDVAAMQKLYKDLLYDYKVEKGDKHGALLKEHIKELGDRWQKMYDEDNEKYKLKLTGTEALAFMQTWEGSFLHFDPFTNLTIQNIIAEIHRQTSNHNVKALISHE